MGKSENQQTVATFGPNNLDVVDTSEKVSITFDPRRIIGQFKSGNPMVCSTGSYRTFDVSGVKVMLHVIGRKEG